MLFRGQWVECDPVAVSKKAGLTKGEWPSSRCSPSHLGSGLGARWSWGGGGYRANASRSERRGAAYGGQKPDSEVDPEAV